MIHYPHILARVQGVYMDWQDLKRDTLLTNEQAQRILAMGYAFGWTPEEIHDLVIGSQQEGRPIHAFDFATDYLLRGGPKNLRKFGRLIFMWKWAQFALYDKHLPGDPDI
jgi:hypothetical protein